MKLVKKKLSDVGSVRNGIAFKSSEYVDGGILLVRQSNISKDVVSLEKSKYLPKSYLEEYQDYKIEYGDYIIGMSGSIGKVSIYKFEEPALQNQRTGVILSNSETTKKYIALFLRYMANVQMSLSKGVAVQNISSKQIESFEIPIPDKREDQQKIVDKIEELFSVVDAVQSSISQVMHSTKNFETSLIRAAFSGDLSGDFFNNDNQDLEHFVKINNIKPLDYNSSFFTYDIPKNWKWVKFSDIADIKGGIAKNSNAKVAESVSLPYLRVANVQRGYFDLSEIKKIKIPKDRVNDLLLKKNDILLTEGGDRDKLGRGWVWESQIDPCTHQNHIFRARINDLRINPWLISTFVNELGKWYFMKEGKQTTNLASISLTKLRNLPVPLIPFEEAEFIFSELQALRSELSNTNEQTRMDLLRIKKLKQSILKQAFEGKLV